MFIHCGKLSTQGTPTNSLSNSDLGGATLCPQSVRVGLFVDKVRSGAPLWPVGGAVRRSDHRLPASPPPTPLQPSTMALRVGEIASRSLPVSYRMHFPTSPSSPLSGEVYKSLSPIELGKGLPHFPHFPDIL